jgi:uncharacterized protein YlbG (UPF0298 family)
MVFGVYVLCMKHKLNFSHFLKTDHHAKTLRYDLIYRPHKDLKLLLETLLDVMDI